MRRIQPIFVLTLLLGLVMVSSVQAKVVTNAWIPYHLTLPPDECIDETLELRGKLHIVITSKKNRTATFMSAHGHGIGLSTNTEYRWQDTIIQFRKDPNGSAFTNHAYRNLRLFASGGGDNEIFQFKSHLKINDDGKTVLDVNKVKTNCRGRDDDRSRS